MDQSFIIFYYLVAFHMNMLSLAFHCLIDGHLVGFQILMVINKATVNILAHIYLET